MDIPGDVGAAAAAVIHAAFAQRVRYIPVEGAAIDTTAIPSNLPAESFGDAGKTARQQLFEIQQADVADKPAKESRIVELDADDTEGQRWRVLSATDRADVAAWECRVEKTST